MKPAIVIWHILVSYIHPGSEPQLARLDVLPNGGSLQAPGWICSYTAALNEGTRRMVTCVRGDAAASTFARCTPDARSDRNVLALNVPGEPGGMTTITISCEASDQPDVKGGR
jgi:hypothetical protein